VSEPSIAELAPVRRTQLSTSLTFFGLGLLTWGVISQIVRLDTAAERPVSFVLLAGAAASWIVALILRQDDSTVAGVAVGALALTGGALAAFVPLAIVFPAVAVLCAAIRWRIQVAAVTAVAGWLALVATQLALGPSPGVILGCLAAMLGGALIGVSRRQAAERTAQLAHAEVEMARVEVEHQRAELLAERNHMAREIHDVLAHTLAALSLQLEAFATVAEAEPGTSPAIRDQIERTRRLVHEGLDEAHRAVRALRDDATTLDDQLARLAEASAAEFAVSGRPAELPAPVVVGLFRVAQEALTNVMKHATGATATVHLSYAGDRVSVVVTNTDASGSPELHESGGGYGLRGIAERLALLGGHMEAGPMAGGWRVSAEVPLPVPVQVRADSVAR
jgi:signal transduction histidine kinase